nr:DUF1028 domain-containing protein [Pontibacillus halophilus]
MGEKLVSTFSIVAYDPESEELGVAVQSKFLGVGGIVPYAEAGVGAVATQSLANPTYGPEGLRLLKEGMSPGATVHHLTREDEDEAWRQVGIVDASGNAATYTGEDCYEWAGGITGNGYAVQGNLLVSEETVTSMAETFEKTEGSLSERLLSSLESGQSAGGDKRGMQSAAILVVKEGGGYDGLTDRLVDLRVDDHTEPIQELKRIYRLHQLYFGESNEQDILTIEGTTKEEMKRHLKRLGYIPTTNISDTILNKSLTTFINTENFEGRAQPDGLIDAHVLEFMKTR